MKEKTLKVFEDHGMKVTGYHTIMGYPEVEIELCGRDSFPGQLEMQKMADEIGMDTLWAECRSNSVTWAVTVEPGKQDTDWEATEGNELAKFYADRLDVDYFAKCVENSVDYLLNECELQGEYLKEELERIKSQIYGLHDVFWLFTSDNIQKIVEPVKKALEGLEDESEE